MTPRHSAIQTPVGHPEHCHKYSPAGGCVFCATTRSEQIEWELDFVRDTTPDDDEPLPTLAPRTKTHRAIDFGWGAAILFCFALSVVAVIGGIFYLGHGITWLVTR